MGPAGRSSAFLRYALPLVRADLELSEDYAHRPGTRLSCPVTAFLGTEDPIVDLDQTEAWREQTDAAFVIHTFPGDHFFHQVHRVAVAAHIAAALG
jgi:medium-chain acyl-[acyl-carrier-protein] hydrolase